MKNKQGTGDEICRIDLGEHGAYVIADDGDTDAYLAKCVENNDGEQIHPSLRTLRADIGEEAFLDALANGSLIVEEIESSTSFTTGGPFVCDDCHRTFPSDDKHEQKGNDVCPDCTN